MAELDTSPVEPVRQGVAYRKLVRSVIRALLLLAVVAVAGPLLSWRSDLAELRRTLEARVTRESSVFADALNLHLELLRAELERIALRPEIDVTDQSNAPERSLLEITHRGSTLFNSGVAVLDASGHRIWAEPSSLPFPPPGTPPRWLSQVLATRAPTFAPLSPNDDKIAVVVPVLRNEQVQGVILGVVDPSDRRLPGTTPFGEGLALALLAQDGQVLVPEAPPPWLEAPAMRAATRQSGQGVVAVTVRDQRWLASTVTVGNTGLRVVLAANEQEAVAPARRRFFLQLVFLALLQVATLGVFVIELRRTSRTFLELEEAASRQQRLLALGEAASLISHEIKNALNGLNAAASLLSTEGESNALLARSVRGQVERLGHLASSLLHFGTPAKPKLAPARLDSLLAEAVEAVRVLPEAPEVEIELGPRPEADLLCDRLLLGAALDNLLRNAVEAGAAAKDTGRIARPRVRAWIEAEERSVRLAIEDNAGGPPAGFEDRIGEPFVTHKPRGVGLGLSMARRAIEQQGGTLTFARTAEGSRFVVTLPRRTG